MEETKDIPYGSDGICDILPFDIRSRTVDTTLLSAVVMAISGG